MKRNIDKIGDDSIEGIAIIGLAGRFPGAENINQFWQNLRGGVESIIQFTDEELKAQGVSPEKLNDPNYVKAGTIIEDVEKFDAQLFGYTPREAEILDPQQRIFLETAWEALENAGYGADKDDGHIGVFAGVSPNDYINRLISNLEPNNVARAFQIQIGNDKDFLSTRVSYKLNLKGPSLTVQTACSSSLVAVQVACQSLLNYQCSMALAGGVSINLSQRNGYYYQEGTIVSPDGHCRAFDAKANGTVLGQGVGIVVLKRLTDALAEGDTIHAVIKGFATNNDGALKAGYTVPSVDGQAEVIALALALSNLAADSIGYVETHGTGTPLGDPVEIAALTQAFSSYTKKKGFCAIGSVKTNIGHADAAAGVAGLIKTVLSLKHKEIPPSLHFEKPNPKIDFENSPFYVNTKLTEWQSTGIPRRAGVSSFGIGGTNAHIILEEAPTIDPSGESRSTQLLLLSSKTNAVLEKATKNLSEYLKKHPQQDLADVAFTLQVGRKVLDHRRMLVCDSLEDAVNSLESLDPDRVLTSFQEQKIWDIVFMFSGQGSQYVDMGLGLYRIESLFKEQVDRCSEILRLHLSLDLRDILYPDNKNRVEAAQKLKQTFITQPSLFTLEYALAKLWMSWGVSPNVLIGHSVGEYTAACLAGVFSLEDALSLVAARARLIQDLPQGSMLVVPLSEEDILPFLDDEISLAAVNSQSFCVVSGESEAIEGLEKRLLKENVDSRRLRTSHAFHSRMMEPILGTFIERVKKIKMNPPQIPIISTVSGTWVTSDEIMSPDYWAKNIRQTVRFFDCIKEVSKKSNSILLEVGPGNTLITLARQYRNKSKERILFSSIRHPNEQISDMALILNTLGRLWLAGVKVDWSGFYENEFRHHIPLPTYPFDHQRYWIDSHQPAQPVRSDQDAYLGKSDISDWFYQPVWKRSQTTKQLNQKTLKNEKLCWLLFVNENGQDTKLVKQLKQLNQEVFTVQAGDNFSSVRRNSFSINPKEENDYENLINELKTLGKLPHKIIHLWCVTSNECMPSEIELFTKFQDLGFYSLIYLTQALARQHITQAIDLVVVTNKLYEVTGGEEQLCAEKATVLGPCKVVPQEYSNITCRSIDLDDSSSEEEYIEKLIGEFSSTSPDSAVAYRGKYRWLQYFEPVKLKSEYQTNSRLKEGGVYLITGGLGGIGIALAEYLAEAWKAKLILTGRSGLPPEEQWEQWLGTHPKSESISRKIRKVKTLKEMGAQVLVVEADVADEKKMKDAILKAEKKFGEINGVIHAAGVFEQASIQEVNCELYQRQLRPKVNGVLVLEKVLKEKSVDFYLLISSLSSVLGGLGYVSYAAANLFMDAFAQRHNQKCPVPWISVNWDAWRFQDEVAQGEGVQIVSADFSILPKEGKDAFARILSWDFGHQVVVSKGDLQGRFNKWITLKKLQESERAGRNEVSSLYSRPSLSSVYIVPGNPTEQAIAEIWQQLLGIDRVGIHDNFFELGGDSLLATQVVTRLRNTFPIEFPMTILFERPTVQLLSKFVLDGQDREPSFLASKERGQRRLERRRQIIIPKKGEKHCE